MDEEKKTVPLTLNELQDPEFLDMFVKEILPILDIPYDEMQKLRIRYRIFQIGKEALLAMGYTPDDLEDPDTYHRLRSLAWSRCYFYPSPQKESHENTTTNIDTNMNTEDDLSPLDIEDLDELTAIKDQPIPKEETDKTNTSLYDETPIEENKLPLNKDNYECPKIDLDPPPQKNTLSKLISKIIKNDKPNPETETTISDPSPAPTKTTTTRRGRKPKAAKTENETGKEK